MANMNGKQYLRLAIIGVCLACGFSALQGCGNSRPKTVSVQGKIIYRNKPVEKVEVQFSPVGAERSALQRIATGEADTDGNYSLSTFTKGDGALPGEYVVTVTQLKRKSNIDGIETGTVTQSPKVPAIYSRQDSSPFKVTIPAEASGALQFDFDLKDQ
jgi:hypothetical protein